jgi:hypothetical protein
MLCRIGKLGPMNPLDRDAPWEPLRGGSEKPLVYLNQCAALLSCSYVMSRLRGSASSVPGQLAEVRLATTVMATTSATRQKPGTCTRHRR